MGGGNGGQRRKYGSFLTEEKLLECLDRGESMGVFGQKKKLKEMKDEEEKEKEKQHEHERLRLQRCISTDQVCDNCLSSFYNGSL